MSINKKDYINTHSQIKRLLKIKKKSTESPAPTGRVINQESIILPTTPAFTADMPLASPTPRTAPTKV